MDSAGLEDSMNEHLQIEYSLASSTPVLACNLQKVQYCVLCQLSSDVP